MGTRTTSRLLGLSSLMLLMGCDGFIGPELPNRIPSDEACLGELPSITRSTARLNERQLANTVRALFPFDVDLGAGFPASVVSSTFSTYPQSGLVYYDHISVLADLADAIALQALEHLSELLPCEPGDVGELACVREFIDGFASRAYRRPIYADEAAVLEGVYTTTREAAESPLSFDLAVAAVISTVLQMPQFLYLIEAGEPVDGFPGVLRLTGHEVASRLSYLLWDAPPDDALTELAANGTLTAPEVLAAEAQRLLRDERAQAGVWRFFNEWLTHGDHEYADRGTAEEAHAWREELRRFVFELVFSGGTLAELIASEQTFVNPALAAFYGLPEVSDWQAVTLPANQRAGILAKAQVSAAHSNPGGTSIVKRGHFVREDLLCQALGAPPAGATAQNPVLPPEATLLERIAARMQMNPCGGCHGYMDYIGIGMEDFDWLARPRAQYADGRSLDVEGNVMGLHGGPVAFTGTAELAATLAASQEFPACVARQWFRFSMGRPEDNNACHALHLLERVRVATEVASSAEVKLEDLMLGMVQSDAFLFRGVE